MIVPSSKSFPSFRVCPLQRLASLFVAVVLSSQVTAAPEGGTIVGGDGSITHSGSETLVNQNTDQLAIDWDSFDVAQDERVQFVQPDSQSTALNRIFDRNGSRIMGQIDANGHVILVNPNGLIFGESAAVNVQGLVASGLNIEVEDYLNGDLAFAGMAQTSGRVINYGLINAATGGNVALMGKHVINRGLISAHLGHIALASGNEAVVTFDNQGLIGLRIDQATLEDEVGKYATENDGSLAASGGKILLNASVSEDLFSQAVNHGNLGGDMQAVVHDDGSFTLGGGHGVINRGEVDVSSSESGTPAGMVVAAGDVVTHRGQISANGASAGSVELQAYNRLNLMSSSTIEANAATEFSGGIRLSGEDIIARSGASISTTGKAVIAGYTNMYLPEVQAHHGYISALDKVRQNGALDIAGNLHLYTLGDVNLRLLDTANSLGSLSMDSEYFTDAYLKVGTDLELGALNIGDSSIRITSTGAGATLSQVPGVESLMTDSELILSADNILLGQGGAQLSLYDSFLRMNFSSSVATNSAIHLDDDYNFSQVRIVGNTFTDRIDLLGSTGVELAAILDEEEGIDIEVMSGDSAYLETINAIVQSGPLHLTEDLRVSLPVGGDVLLDNPDNAVDSLAMNTAYYSYVVFENSSSLALNDLTLFDSDVYLSTSQPGAEIRQNPNTSISGADTILNLSSDVVEVGANGSSDIALSDSYLEIHFNDLLHINGSVALDYLFSGLQVYGSDGPNEIVVGSLASLDINSAEFVSNILSLGAGDDLIRLYTDLPMPVLLGEGADILELYGVSIAYDLQDFSIREDEIKEY